MSRSRYLLAISVVAGCGDPHATPDAACGPGGAPDVGLVAAATGVTLTYGHLSASANNDCPDPMAPQGVISLTITSSQTDGTGLFTLCIGRPDLLDTTALALGTQVKLVDVTGSAGGCTFVKDSAAQPTGTAKGAGACGHGSSHAGFALTVEGGLSLTRTCGATVDTVAVTLAGTVAVTVP